MDRDCPDWHDGFVHGFLYDNRRYGMTRCAEYISIVIDDEELCGILQKPSFFQRHEDWPVARGVECHRKTLYYNREKFLEQVPQDEKSWTYKTGFLEGRLCKQNNQIRFRSSEERDWILDFAPVLGYTVLRCNKLWINLSKNPIKYIVDSISLGYREEEVFCMVEPETQRFTLCGGLVTGNCAFTSTRDLDKNPTKPFTFLMDASMLGVGTGGDTKGAGKCKIYQPNAKTEVYVIPDTREGWVRSVELLLNSYMRINRNTIEFDYNEIRKEGVPLKTFGGVSSGPGPLIELHDSIRNLLNRYVGNSLDSRGIVDLFNLIGVCVISGNIRRTAEICFGEPGDTDFMDLKNYEKNPDRAAYGWTSNNSVFAELGMEYEEIAKRIHLNGEPGVAWLENMRKYSRLCDPPDNKDYRVMGGNPCVPGDTLIMTTDGLQRVHDLVGKPFKVIVDDREYPSGPKGFWCTGEKDVFKVTLLNGLVVRATHNHKILTKGGIWKEVGELSVENDEIAMSMNQNLNKMIYDGGKGTFDEGYVLGLSIADGTVFPVERMSFNFSRGLLSGIFDADGHIECTGGKFLICVVQNNLQRLKSIQVVLTNLGIASNIDDDPDERDGQQYFRLCVGCYQDFARFKEIIGFSDSPKQELLDNLLSAYKARGTLHNYSPYCKIKSIEHDGTEEVFDAEIQDIHRFSANGVIVHNCLEQSLESYELCNLVETFPHHHETLQDFRMTLKYAYLYAKTVTLLPTHWSNSNKVMMRNRRIGTSISGVAQFLADRGIESLRQWLDEGYKYLQKCDELYSGHFCVPRSIKITSVKPSGSVSLLAGATPGVHFPISNYYIRRVVLAKTSPFVHKLREAGYNVVESAYDAKHSMVVEIPVSLGDNVRTLENVSMWEQLHMAAFMQKWWADNQVSCTVSFDRETEGPHIAAALKFFQYDLKGISFLPKDNKAYPQMPYEPITAEKYHELMEHVKPVEWESEIYQEEPPSAQQMPAELMYCDGDKCAL
jgi:ribonucleotide reductase alpha subunit